MATKKNTDNKPARVWKGFKNVELTADDKAAFLAWPLEDSDIFAGLEDIIATGHKITLSYNESNETYSCSLTGTDTSPNHGYTMSSFARELWTAMKLAAYKHTIMCDGVWDTHSVDADFG